MKFEKRECDIKIKLYPTGSQFLGICFYFFDQKVSFSASSAVAGQFGDFLSALYALFLENDECYNDWKNIKYHTKEGTVKIVAATTTVEWDNEGTTMFIEMTKYYEGENVNKIFLKITTDYGKNYKEFIVEDKDLCYAVAKACTDVLKQYGIYGYRYSTEYDFFAFHKLLFIKAYALGCLEVRKLMDDEFSDAKKTDFSKEIELLLFDM